MTNACVRARAIGVAHALKRANARRCVATRARARAIDVWLYDPSASSRMTTPTTGAQLDIARVTTEDERHSMERTPERLLARAFARRVLASYGATNREDAARAMTFVTNARGKPRVGNVHEGGVERGFSVAHCDGVVAVAVRARQGSEDEREIGCDVERAERRIESDIAKFSARWFSGNEREMLESIDDVNAKALTFMKLWTLKEAYVKALGLGIAGRPFREFDVTWRDAPDGARFAIDGVDASRATGEKIWMLDLRDDGAPTPASAWSLALLKPDRERDHVVALCVPAIEPGERAHIRVRWASPFDDVVDETTRPVLLGASSHFLA